MSKIGLIDVDSHNFPNLALMKIASFHKSKNDDVEWLNYLSYYDIAYKSKIFNFSTEDNHYINAQIIYSGGTGYNLSTILPEEIENSQPNYYIYPQYNFSIQLFSRGCIRDCDFCVVKQKEGYIKTVSPMNLNPFGRHIEILDNNFLANPEWKSAIDYLLASLQRVNLHGVDVRIMNEEQGYWLNKLKLHKRIHIAWDSPKLDITNKLIEVTKYIKPYKLMCYVLIGFNSTPEWDMYRIERLRELKISPFVMPYDKTDLYQKKLARWVNHKAIFNTTSFANYKSNGFRKNIYKNSLF